MSKSEYERIRQIDSLAESNQPLSDADSGWLIDFAKQRKDDVYVSGLRMLHASAPFKHSTYDKWPAGRRTEIVELGKRMVRFPYKNIHDEQRRNNLSAVVFSGCIVLGNSGDKTALPLLQSMTTSGDAAVIMTAKQSVKELEIR